MHLGTGSSVMVAALEGTKREKQRVQSFASLLAASMVPDDGPSSEHLSSLTDLQPLRLIRASEVVGQLQEARSRANGGKREGGWV